MSIFETETPMKAKAAMSKWHLILALVLINIAGFAAAQVYFAHHKADSRTQTEAQEMKKSYGANVRDANTLMNWGFRLLMILKDRN
ncbi:MAG: hypothetical protein JNL57_09785 [Bacteroidetes bacterium]|nr:hypothetical protein [Bacteroidota bacterium]